MALLLLSWCCCKMRATTKQLLHVLLHASIFKIRIPKKWTDRTRSAVDKMSHSLARECDTFL
jgi:hypothetical protein